MSPHEQAGKLNHNTEVAFKGDGALQSEDFIVLGECSLSFLCLIKRHVGLKRSP